jgi:hypothetical protein
LIEKSIPARKGNLQRLREKPHITDHGSERLEKTRPAPVAIDKLII